MPHWLSITWENDRLMLLAARTQGKSTIFEHAAVLKLHSADKPDAPEGETQNRLSRNSQPSLKKQLGQFLREKKIPRSDIVVLLSRADVEVRPLVFPPVPVEELPDLVKFQATKEFNGYDPSSPLDFFITNKLDNVSRSTLFPAVRPSGKQKSLKPVAPSSGSPKHILASTIRNDTFGKIQRLCSDLNLTLRRVVLRPCEAVYLLKQKKAFDPNRTILFVELDANETSQTVIFQGEPVFMRSPKISCPEDVTAPDFVARLVAELKRTRIAVRNEIQGVAVDDVILCGVGERYDILAKEVSEGMEIPVRTFDPWAGLSLGTPLRKLMEEKRQAPWERFAGPIGAAIRAGHGETSEIDFCNPKKRPEPVGQRQLVTGVLAAALFLLVAFIGYGFYARSSLNQEVKSLSFKKFELEKTAKTVGTDRVQLKAIDDWLADDVDWFEQLGWLSRHAPGARDMILTELTLSANQRGSMALKTLVRDSSVVSPMEESLRADQHDVRTAEKGEVKGNPLYGFKFNLTVSLTPQSGAAAAETVAIPAPVEARPEVTPKEEKPSPSNGQEGTKEKEPTEKKEEA